MRKKTMISHTHNDTTTLETRKVTHGELFPQGGAGGISECSVHWEEKEKDSGILGGTKGGCTLSRAVELTKRGVTPQKTSYPVQGGCHRR